MTQPTSKSCNDINGGLAHAQQALNDVVDHAVVKVNHGVDHARERVDAVLGDARDKIAHARDAVGHALDTAKGSVGHAFDGTIVRTRSVWRRMIAAVVNWFDTSKVIDASSDAANKIDWLRVVPFIGVHLMCFGVIWVGFSWFALWVALGLYLIRMFAITAFYHRYFSHKTFKTSRLMQFAFAMIGASAVQRGPLWWAAHHRNHHRHSDQPEDLHSPRQHGFWRAHMGWFMTPNGFVTHSERIPDLNRFPELKWVDRFDVLMPVVLATALFFLGGWLEQAHPELGTSGPQLLIWGFFVSTVVLFHGTVTINSLSHVWGTRRYRTRDDSRNNWFLAIITLGEGWHNNHHHFPGSTRQGFFWWEYDITWYALKVMSWLGLVWDLKAVPPELKHRNLIDRGS
jgi:stearoyl-CoA desaturase (delta-9 desaturase)